MRVLAALTVVLFLIGPKSTQAQANDSELLAAFIDWPPISIHKGAGIEGIGSDVVDEIAKRKNIKIKKIQIPTTRTDELIDQAPVIFGFITKSAKREGKVDYIGVLKEDQYCFLTLKAKPINSLEEARKATSITGNKGTPSSEFLLKQGGFDKILDFSTGSAGGMRKVFGGKVDAMISSKETYRHAAKAQGFDPDQVVCQGNFWTTSYFVGASKKVPADILKKVQEGFAELEKEGFIQKTSEKYKL